MKINGFGQLHRLLLNENYVINGSGVAASDEYLSLRGHAVNMRGRKGPVR